MVREALDPDRRATFGGGQKYIDQRSDPIHLNIFIGGLDKCIGL